MVGRDGVMLCWLSSVVRVSWRLMCPVLGLATHCEVLVSTSVTLYTVHTVHRCTEYTILYLSSNLPSQELHKVGFCQWRGFPEGWTSTLGQSSKLTDCRIGGVFLKLCLAILVLNASGREVGWRLSWTWEGPPILPTPNIITISILLM